MPVRLSRAGPASAASNLVADGSSRAEDQVEGAVINAEAARHALTLSNHDRPVKSLVGTGVVGRVVDV